MKNGRGKITHHNKRRCSKDPTLHDTKNYLCHYRIVELYIQIAMRATEVSRLLKCSQMPYLKEFIEMNRTLRKISKRALERVYAS